MELSVAMIKKNHTESEINDSNSNTGINTIIIDGKFVANQITEKLKPRIKVLEKKLGINPCLTVVLIGNNPASQIYVKNKREKCKVLGINSELLQLESSILENELLGLIEELNNNVDCHGILVQLPIPAHINAEKILEAIIPEKDVDGFHPSNLGSLFAGNEKIVPCTPKGIIRLLEHYKVEISGKNAVVVGRSNIVGKPIAALLLNRNATVTICHSRTKNLAEFTKNADILISAVGKSNLITQDMVKKGAVVIDVAINREDKDGVKIIKGDVDFEKVKNKSSLITPVPGGVGPMTIAMLMENLVELAEGKYSEFVE